MKKLTLWSLAGLLAATSPAALAQDKPAPGQTPNQSTPAAPDTKQTITLKLIDAGAEPRKELRYSPKVGASTSSTIRMKMASSTGMMEMSMPVMIMTVDMKVNEVRDNGDIAYEAVFSNMDVEAAEGDNPMIAQQMRAALGSMKGTRIQGVMTNRGEAKDADFKLPEGVNAQSKQLMDSLRQSVAQLSAPLPTEPIGKGAKWTMDTTITNMGMTIKQTTTATLKDLSGTAFTLDIGLSQSADKQPVNMPGMPGNMKVELVNLKTSGTGEIKGDTTAILPSESKASMTSEQDLSIGTGEGDGQIMKQTIKVETTSRSGPTADNKEAPKDEPKPSEKPAAPADAPKK